MRLFKSLFAAAAVLTLAAPAIASARPSWDHYDGGYHHNYDRGDYGRTRYMREREIERQRAFERARWYHEHAYRGEHRDW